MILLQIVNGESWDSSREQIVSPSPEPSSPSSKNYKSEIENAWAFMLPDIYKIMFCKVQRRLKEICVVKQQPQEQPQKSYEQDILQKHLRVDRSLRPIRDACHDFVILLGVFGHVYASGVRQTQTADLQTADLQTCRPADLQTCRLADLRTCRHVWNSRGGGGG